MQGEQKCESSFKPNFSWKMVEYDRCDLYIFSITNLNAFPSDPTKNKTIRYMLLPKETLSWNVMTRLTKVGTMI